MRLLHVGDRGQRRSPSREESLAANPRLGSWLRISPDGIVEIRSGKVELGQGVLTALAQVAAEELDVDVARIEMTAATTDLSPDEGLTAGSLSIQQSGAALRQVCAEVRDIFAGIAADKLAVPKEELIIEDGQIAAPDGVATSYWELADDTLLDRAPDGDVLSWRHEIWSGSFISRPGMTPNPAFLATSHRTGGQEIRSAGEPPQERGGGASRNAVPGYAFPAYEVVNHLLTTMPLRTSALRSLGAHLNVFAVESFMDELAAEAGRDPVEFRLAHLSDPRARAVLEHVVRQSDWESWTPADAVGHGIGYARYKNTSAYCAVVAEVEAVQEVRVRRLTVAVDAGLVINPDGAANQIEGGAIQSTSWTVMERVRFDRLTVTSNTWETYPILRFSEVPAVDVDFLPGDDNPPLGVGECAQGPTAAAIANAVADALGVRVRSLPLTPEQIVAAMPT